LKKKQSPNRIWKSGFRKKSEIKLIFKFIKLGLPNTAQQASKRKNKYSLFFVILFCLWTKFPDSEIIATWVARWFVFKPKIPIWVNFGGPWNGKCFYILWPFGIFYWCLGYFMTIGCNVSGFGTMHQEKSGNPDSNDPLHCWKSYAVLNIKNNWSVSETGQILWPVYSSLNYLVYILQARYFKRSATEIGLYLLHIRTYVCNYFSCLILTYDILLPRMRLPFFIFVVIAFISPFNTQKCILHKSFYTQRPCCGCLKTLYPCGISNPGLLVPETDVMSTAPRLKGTSGTTLFTFKNWPRLEVDRARALAYT
jgi:hypothetical protein